MAQRLKSSVFLTLLSLSLFCAAPANAITDGDYDGDGLSDFEVVKVNKDARTNTGTTTWFVRRSSNQAVQQTVFPIPGDALVKFQIDGKNYPGVVWVRSASQPLVWKVLGPHGFVDFAFGLPGDIIPSQRFTLGPGQNTLPVVVRPQQNGTLRWFVLLPGGAVGETVFGLVGDQVAMGPDGTLLALRNNYTWFGKQFFDNTQLSFARQWGLPGDIPMVPLNVGQLVIVRPTGAGQVAFVLNGDGSNFTQPLGPDNSIPNIGRFFGNLLDFGWHERSTGTVRAFNSFNGGVVSFHFGDATMAIVTPPGEVFQPSSSGRFPSGGGPTPGPGPGPGEPPTNPGLASRCGTVRALLRGEIYKSRASNHISPGDPRAGSTSFITNSGTPAPQFPCLEAYDSNGNLVHKLGFYGAGGAYSSRYYGGSGCGDRKSPSSIANLATQNSGSPAIHIKVTSNSCVRVPHANLCFNSTGC